MEEASAVDAVAGWAEGLPARIIKMLRGTFSLWCLAAGVVLPLGAVAERDPRLGVIGLGCLVLSYVAFPWSASEKRKSLAWRAIAMPIKVACSCFAVVGALMVPAGVITADILTAVGGGALFSLAWWGLGKVCPSSEEMTTAAAKALS
jgi:hypothetical protein